MNGHFEFYEENNMFFLQGIFEADFAFTEEEITPGRDLKFIGNWDLLKRKEDNPKYLKIYERIPDKNNMLASNITEFSDLDVEDVKFAEKFFGDIEVF